MKRLQALSILVSLALCSSITIAQNKTEDTQQVKVALLNLIDLSNRQALGSPEARQLLSGEALDWKMPTFGKIAASPDKIVLTDTKAAVGRVQWFGRDDYVADLYFYLTFDGAWKVQAVRRLALTGIIEGAYRYLKTKPNPTPEEQNDLGNFELLLASDAALRKWFNDNVATMNKLYEMSRVMKKGDYSSQNDPKYADIKKLMKSLHLGSIEVGLDGSVEFIIGGVTDNTVGFLYSPTNKPPAISSESYIWVEEVAPKWFIFRTT